LIEELTIDEHTSLAHTLAQIYVTLPLHVRIEWGPLHWRDSGWIEKNGSWEWEEYQ
jgi:hypothetical protein